MTLTSDSLGSENKPKRKRSGRKRKKSKPSPNVDKGFLKKIKQSDIDTESESDYFLDAQVDLSQDDLSSSTPKQHHSNIPEPDQELDNSHTPNTIDIHNISLPGSESGSETFVKSVVEPNTMENISFTQTQQSQSILDGAGIGGDTHGPHTELGTTGVPQMVQIPQNPHMSHFQQGFATPGTSMGYPAPQYQPMQNMQVELSDHDVMRIAMQTKLLLGAEIDKLVQEKVLKETADLQSRVTTLETDNKNLQDSITVLETKLSTRIDDLEQYSRRSCIRIAGIPETEHENTDDKVLDLAAHLNIQLNPRDIDRSHRVGPARTSTTSIADEDEPQPSRPREIIVKLRSYQARLSLLQGRKTLRVNKEKIYINEDLTKTRKSLAYECRQLKRERKIVKTWVYDGNVFVTNRGGTRLKITQNNELDEYRKLKVPPAAEDPVFPRHPRGS